MFGREGLGREPAGLLRWARVQRGCPPRYGGGGTPGRRAQGAPGRALPRPPGAGAPPPPTPPEGQAGVGAPRRVLQDRVRHCFLAYCSSPAPPTPS